MAEPRHDRVVVCRVGGLRLALPVQDVREVCTEIPVVRMPGVAAPVEGVANVRGTLVTVVRASELLRQAGRPAGASPWLVVLRYRGGRVALGVDDVEDLGRADDSVTRLEWESELIPLFGPG